MLIVNPPSNKRWDRVNTPRNPVCHTIFDHLTDGGIAKGEMIYVGASAKIYDTDYYHYDLSKFTNSLSRSGHVVFILRDGDKWYWQTNRGRRYFDDLHLLREYIKQEQKVALIMSSTRQDVSACDFVVTMDGIYVYLIKNNFGPTGKRRNCR